MLKSIIILWRRPTIQFSCTDNDKYQSKYNEPGQVDCFEGDIFK